MTGPITQEKPEDAPKTMTRMVTRTDLGFFKGSHFNYMGALMYKKELNYFIGCKGKNWDKYIMVAEDGLCNFVKTYSNN